MGYVSVYAHKSEKWSEFLVAKAHSEVQGHQLINTRHYVLWSKAGLNESLRVNFILETAFWLYSRHFDFIL